MPQVLSAPTSLRLFVAAPLPATMKDILEREVAAYRHPSLRFIPRQNLHLTLHFIGSVSPAIYQALDQVLRPLASGATPFQLVLQEIAPGPAPQNPRLLWARFEAHDLFERLSLQLAEAIGVSNNPHQHPIPHVTLARFRKDGPKPTDLPVIRPQDPAILEVSSFALWQSTLQQPHPEYRILEEYPFGGGD